MKLLQNSEAIHAAEESMNYNKNFNHQDQENDEPQLLDSSIFFDEKEEEVVKMDKKHNNNNLDKFQRPFFFLSLSYLLYLYNLYGDINLSIKSYCFQPNQYIASLYNKNNK